MSAQPLLHNWQRHRAAPVSQPLKPGSLSHLPRAESLSMSPASLMTFGPCSTPPLFCQGERTGGVLVSLVCESVWKEKIESRVCEIFFFFLPSSPVLSKTERPEPPPTGLCSACACGPAGSGEAGTEVLSKPCLPWNSPDRAGPDNAVTSG